MLVMLVMAMVSMIGPKCLSGFSEHHPIHFCTEVTSHKVVQNLHQRSSIVGILKSVPTFRDLRSCARWPWHWIPCSQCQWSWVNPYLLDAWMIQRASIRSSVFNLEGLDPLPPVVTFPWRGWCVFFWTLGIYKPKSWTTNCPKIIVCYCPRAVFVHWDQGCWQWWSWKILREFVA